MSPQHQGTTTTTTTTGRSFPFDNAFTAKDDEQKKPAAIMEVESTPSAAASSPEQASQSGIIASSQEEDPLALALSPSDSSSLDPFGIGSLTQQHRRPPDPATNNNHRNASSTLVRDGSRASTTATGNPMLALPPKMLVKLTTYEEVTSVAAILDPGTSRISVEGSVYIQLHSSDARRNAPFQLVPVAGKEVSVKPINKYSHRVNNALQNSPVIVTLPKQELGYVPVLNYSYEQIVDHMPVLLERKVTIHEDSCRIAYQVRTKLTNKGDLRDFTLAVAIPEKVDADSIEILKGDGVYDGLKRVIKYKLASLVKGESFMVSAQAKLWKALEDDEEIHFPVVMRCTSSEDQISNVDFSVVEAPGQPSSLTVHKAQSFRLLHRLS
mmetsp:Transcript_266/g.502  ORF Transcript_266/g.502 Transcript_266/m.502 type:complete len:382 (-) Transcript_266:72-1217(-)